MLKKIFRFGIPDAERSRDGSYNPMPRNWQRPPPPARPPTPQSHHRKPKREIAGGEQR